MNQPEIYIVITPEGMDRTEVLSPDDAQKDLAIEIYSKFALEIHRFGQRLDQILEAEIQESDGQGIRICE